MNKKILILSGSPRKGGNSDLLCDEFMCGLQKNDNEVEKIFLRDKKIEYCTACYYCRDTSKGCAIKDDMTEILDKMLEANVIAMSSPVYFYSIDAQMKTVIDRTVVKWRDIKNKEFYYIITAAENGSRVAECTLECMRGFAACLDGSKGNGRNLWNRRLRSWSSKKHTCV